MNEKRRVPIFWGCVATLVVVYIVFKFIAPIISMWIVGKSVPLPLPNALIMIYMILAIVGVAIFISTSEDKMEEFLQPILGFFRGGQSGILGMLRMGALAAVPVLIGWMVYSSTAPSVKPLTAIRVQHPTIPGKFEKMVNPLRDPSDERVQKWVAETGFQGAGPQAKTAFVDAMIAEGRGLFQVNCRPCHGSRANGNGPMSWGLRLRPADFTDPGTIATVVEPYLFWRITEGAFGLPQESTPWDSAMPAWGDEFSEEDKWKIIMADYDLSGAEPRMPEKIH